MQIAPLIPLDRFLPFEDSDVPVDAWSLEELDQLADLESVRSACRRTDYAEAWRES